jgi:hypothetical protein
MPTIAGIEMTIDEVKSFWEEAGEAMRLHYQELDATGNYKWPELLSPFAETDAPTFPVECLPKAMGDYCREHSKASGFDVGAYAFSLFLYAAALIDHRHKIDVGPFKAPAFLWGGLVDKSGGGKSPVFRAARRFVDEINADLCSRSKDALEAWKDDCKAIGSRKKDEWPERPPWKQIIGIDTTTESLGDCLHAMPSGILLGAEEITELIGRMDAYTSGAGGKDRGLYLRAFDGGFSTINRKSADAMVFSNFSFAIVAGMQPKKLAELFRRNGGSSDGLYQRFLLYQMRPPTKADYDGHVMGHYIDSCREIFTRLHSWGWDDLSKPFELCREARAEMQEYHNACREIATTGGGDAFSEHVNKFPGFLARVTLALHLCECAAVRHLQQIVSLETYHRAEMILKRLFRHSSALYILFDGHMERSGNLAQSAAECVLHHKWESFHRGDLTRSTSCWRNAAEPDAQAALDLLIEYGWICDATPPTEPGKRGRRSKGYYVVNPRVHPEFMPEAERISHEKFIKKMAIDRAVMSKREGNDYEGL